MGVKSKENELVIIRTFNAPLKVVWDAWTDPKQLAQWWGPRGFTLTTHSKDLKTGGHWLYTMHGPDGTDYKNKIAYLEVEQYKKLFYDLGGSDEQKPLFRVTVLFSESGGKTHMDMRMSFPTKEDAEQTRKFIKKAGGTTTWDRLAEYLEKEVHGQERFVINRTFNCLVEEMFEMWTDPNHLGKWISPGPGEVHFIRADVKVGSGNFYYMEVGPNQKMYGRTEYKSINRPNLIVYTQQFCDEDEKVTGHPMAEHWPKTMLTTVEITAEDIDQTRVTLTWEPYGDTTAEEVDTFTKAKGGMSQGWSGSFDHLEEYLVKQPATPV